MRRVVSALVACVIVAGAPACYRYTPVQSPRAGMDVRAQLETEAAVRRSQGLDEPVLNYDGVIVEVTPETLALDVLVARSTSAFQEVEIRDTVRLRTDEVQSIMQRSLSPVRSALFAVGAGVAAFAIVKSIDAVVGGTGDDDDGNGPPPALRIPVFSWSSSLVPAILRRRDE